MHVLLIDDATGEAGGVIVELAHWFPGATIERSHTLEAIVGAAPNPFDVIIVRHTLGRTTALDASKALGARRPDCPVVLLAPRDTDEAALGALAAGFDECVLESEGRFPGLDVHVRKAQELTRWRRAAEEADAQHRELWDGMPVGLYRSTPDGTILDANCALCEMLAYPDRGVLLAVNASALYADHRDRDRWQALMESEGVVGGFETRLRRHDGQVIWARETARLIRHTGPHALIYEGAMEDITARRRAQDILQQGEELFRSLVEHASDIVVASDQEGVVHYVSPSVEEALAYPPREVLGTRIADLVHPDDLPRFRESIVRTYAEPGRAQSLECRMRRRDGSWRCLESRGMVLQDPSGSPRLVAIYREITERKQGELLLCGQNRVLEMIAAGTDLASILESLLVTIEEQSPAMVLSVLLLDPHSGALRHVAAPRLPRRLVQALEGFVTKGPAPSGESLAMADMASGALWVEVRGLAAGEGLWIGWSTPILSSERRVVGVLALYTRGPWRPQARDLQLLETTTRLAGIAIERQRVQDSLRASEARYRTLFDANPAPLFVYARDDLRFLAVNQAAVDACGYSMEEFRRMSVPEICPPEDLMTLRAHLAKDRPPREQAGLWRMRRKDGAIIDVEVTSHELAFDGRACRLVLAQDITERRRAEAERARLTLAVEQAAESIMITDLAGTILYVNPAFERISGYDRAEVVGQNPRIVKSGKHDEAFYRSLWGALVQGEVWRGHICNRRKNGTLYETEATISPVRDGTGSLVSFVAVQRDETHERHLEEQLRQSQKMEAVGRLAGGVAHDFNNLLNVITGYSLLLLNALGQDDPIRAKVDQILKASERAADLVQQLLAFSRRQVLQPKVLDLNLVVTTMDSMLRRLIGENIDLLVLREEALWAVKADPGQVEQVVMNLVVNARDSMPQGGRLTIETRNVELDESYARGHMGARPGAYVVLAVSDTGSGMDTETQAHLFEPFFTTKDKGRGTGLGLSMVYGIVKQSDGHVWVYSEVGRGSTIKIYLPRVEGTATPPVEVAPAAVAVRGSETVLLVEDERLVREMLVEILRGSGYTVMAAGDGEEALALSQQCEGAIHLLVTDVVMPGMSGRALAERLTILRPETRVLYISGYAEDAIVRHGILDPGLSFLSKPVTPDALLRKMRELLDEGKPGGPGTRR